MRLTPLAVAVLGLLRERRMHPYEMHQVLSERHVDELLKLRPGTLYHTVDRLHANGLIADVCVDSMGNRPERTSYRLTSAGSDVMENWLREQLSTPVEEYPAYPYALTEAHNLPADEAIEALTERCERLDARATHLEAIIKSLEPGPDYIVYRLGARRLVAMLRAEAAWTRELIESIESKEFPWQPHHP